MTGYHVQVCRLTKYNAPAISSGSNENVIAQFIDTLGWRTGVLMVRVYAKTSTPNTGTIYVYNSMVSADAPASVFVEEASPLASAAIDGNFPAGMLKSVAFSSSVPIGRYVTVTLKWTGTPTGDITLGVDLIGRDC